MNVAINTSDGKRCEYCPGSMFHLGGVCPLVKAYEYYQDGTLKRVEFFGEKELTKKTIPGEVGPICIKCHKPAYECGCVTPGLTGEKKT